MQSLGIVAFVFGLALTTITVLGLDGCPEHLSSDVVQREFGGKCYAFFPSRRTFRSAGSQCLTLGGLLAMPKTKAINDFLTRTLRMYSKLNRRVWIGLSDKEKENHYRWVDGTYLYYKQNFSNFGNNEGFNYGSVYNHDEDRIALDPSGTWHDYRSVIDFGLFVSVKNAFPYICEFKQKLKPTTAAPKSKPTRGTPKTKPTRGTPKTKPTRGTPKTKPTRGTSKTKPTRATPKPMPTPTVPINQVTLRLTRAHTTPKCVPLSRRCPDKNCGLDGYKFDAQTGCYKCQCNRE